MQQDDTVSHPQPAEPGVTPPPATADGFRLWPGGVLAAVAVLLASLVGFGSTLLSPPPRPDAPADAVGSNPSPPRALTAKEVVQRNKVVATTLRKRARAVVNRDREAFMADVDRRNKRFLQAQRQLYDNLAQVPFAAWRYRLTEDGYERPELARKYGNAPIYLPPLVLYYAIKGFDDQDKPVAVPLVMTFVKRGSDWQIASDSDVDVDLPAGGHAEPWDRRPMVVGRGKRVLVLADAEDSDDLDELVEVAEASVRRVARMWPSRWRKKVVISAVRDQQLIETYFRSELQTSENVAAIAVHRLTEVTNWVNEPAEDVDLAGYRIIINPKYFEPRDAFNALLLTHEIAHVATGRYTWNGAPTWLVEGAAEYTATRGVLFDEIPRSLRKQADAGAVALPGYEFYQRDVEANYVASQLACTLIAEKYGEATLRKLYLRLGRVAREIHTLEEQEEAFQELLGVDTAEFERQLAQFIKTRK